MKQILFLLLLFYTFSCTKKNEEVNDDTKLNLLAEKYIRLGLTIGQYDADFVDAYYGPDSLKPAGEKQTVFPKDSLLAEVDSLHKAFQKIASDTKNDTLKIRANWISRQLIAFGRRIKIFSGEYASFDEESKDLFDAVAPVYSESHYQSLISKLDSLLPGKGALPERFQKLANRFLVPKNKIDTVFRTTIAEARKRSYAHYALPSAEKFSLEYVYDKPWSGYNWYQGNYNSNIQINLSQPIFIERAIDLGCHEGYPGHHVFNMLLEKNLYRDKGWPEICLYPLFSPQSLIAEGSANYGISVAFPGNEARQFSKDVLLPLAGLDTAYADVYFRALSIKSKLVYVKNEAARGIINGTMTDQQAVRWLTDYCLLTGKSAVDYIRFIKKYRSYVINYSYGQDLVKSYVESNGGTREAPDKRWELFGRLLSSEITPTDLLSGKK